MLPIREGAPGLMPAVEDENTENRDEKIGVGDEEEPSVVNRSGAVPGHVTEPNGLEGWSQYSASAIVRLRTK